MKSLISLPTGQLVHYEVICIDASLLRLFILFCIIAVVLFSLKIAIKKNAVRYANMIKRRVYNYGYHLFPLSHK